jgi:uncharacterized Zn finger protein
MRESAAVKGRRLLTEGRLTVTGVEPDRLSATVRGDSAEIYACGWDRRSGWWCTCPALTRCSHLTAFELVVIRPGADRVSQVSPQETRSR